MRSKWLFIILIGVMLFGAQAFVADEGRSEESQSNVLIDLFGDEFVSADEVAAAIEQGLVDDLSAGPNDEDLVFTPVKPCRIYDSRKTCSLCGVFNPGNSREFYVYGTSDIVNQGGNAAGCPSPRGEPRAVHINVTAVPLGNGNILAYPFGSTAPNASLVNYRSDAQNIANSGTIKTCFNCTRDINVKSNFGATHVAIDVLGYHYLKP